MTWENIMRRMLPSIRGVPPHTTSEYGATNRPPGSTNPHRGVDFNYNVPGQNGINLLHPALHSPVTGVVTNAGEGTAGRIAIRDANGFTHEILHTHTRRVAVGDRVAAGQLIGTMGNTGVNRKDPKNGAHHVHYQMKDPAGNVINPQAFWNGPGPIDPNPAPPAFLGEYRRYRRDFDSEVGGMAPPPMSEPFSTGRQFVQGSASTSRPLYETRTLVPSPDDAVAPDNNVRRLVRVTGPTAGFLNDLPTRSAVAPNEFPSEGTVSFDDRFGDWNASPGTAAPRGLNQDGQAQPARRPLGIVSGRPMPDYQFPLPIWAFPDEKPMTGNEDWAGQNLRRADWKKVR